MFGEWGDSCLGGSYLCLGSGVTCVWGRGDLCLVRK